MTLITVCVAFVVFRFLCIARGNPVVGNPIALGVAGVFFRLAPCIVCIAWVRRFCKAGLRDLGVTEGRWNIGMVLAVGIVIGAASAGMIIAARGQGVDLQKTLLRLCAITNTLSAVGPLALTPLSEEIFFRGFVYPFAASRVGANLGLVLQSALWTLMHFIIIVICFGAGVCSWSRYVELFVLGLVLGVLCQRSRSLYPALICHSTHNLAMMATA